jgi:hypothetical protein
MLVLRDVGATRRWWCCTVLVVLRGAGGAARCWWCYAALVVLHGVGGATRRCCFSNGVATLLLCVTTALLQRWRCDAIATRHYCATTAMALRRCCYAALLRCYSDGVATLLLCDITALLQRWRSRAAAQILFNFFVLNSFKRKKKSEKERKE